MPDRVEISNKDKEFMGKIAGHVFVVALTAAAVSVITCIIKLYVESIGLQMEPTPKAFGIIFVLILLIHLPSRSQTEKKVWWGTLAVVYGIFCLAYYLGCIIF